MIDIKPPGIFLILAGFQAIFGYSIFGIRLLGAAWISLTSFMLYKTGTLLFKDQKAAFASGLIYIFFISTWSFYGLSLQPEIFFNLFTILSLYTLLKFHKSWKFFLAGFLAGLGFVIKYFVLLDFAVFVFFILFIDNDLKSKGHRLIHLAIALAFTGLGFVLPFGTANMVYYLNGHFDAFYDIIYLAPGRYPSPFGILRMSKFILDYLLRFLPIFLFYVLALIDHQKLFKDQRKVYILLILWTLSSLVAVLISGKRYGHYTIQMMLPVSMMAGLYFHSGRKWPGFLQWIQRRKTAVVMMLFLVVLISLLKLEYVLRPDYPRQIAKYLKPRLKKEDVIYTGNYHHILYYLLKKDSPTPYIHRSLLTQNPHIRALGIDADKEFEKIMLQDPLYILTEHEYPDNPMKEFILNNYHVEMKFGTDILLYRRNS